MKKIFYITCFLLGFLSAGMAAPTLSYYPPQGNKPEDWSQDTNLSDLITRYAASSSLWHPMLNKGDKYLPNSTDQFRATLRGRYLCMRFDSPHTFRPIAKNNFRNS
jgi:hypothetical protein